MIIAEVAQSHDGSLGLAHAFIDAAADAGADAIKFQTHIAAAESTPHEPFRVRFGPQDPTRYEYWQRMEFTPDQWQGLADHALEADLVFLSSPFSLEAVDLLEHIGMPMWKIASGEVANEALLDRVASTGRPILLSSGMSPLAELDAVLDRLRLQGALVALLQCSTRYPCPPEDVGLNLIEEFRQRYDCFVGLSDHSGTIYPGLAGATLGIDVLEVHMALSRKMFGPDVGSSVTTGELTQLVQGIRFIEQMLANPVDKNAAAEETAAMREIFMRSLVAREDLIEGTVLEETQLVAKKPGTGIPAARISEVLGRRLARAVQADSLLSWEDLADPEDASAKS